MTQDDADRIVRDARSVFTSKTTNKLYDLSDKPYRDNDLDTVRTVIGEQKTALAGASDPGETMRLAKAIRRNENLLAAQVSNARGRNPASGTPYERGKAMMMSHAALEAGNCSEQAMIACYLAIERFPDDAKGRTHLGSIAPPGDHAFCLVGATSPFWICVEEMSADAEPGLWVIDPWLNFACRASEYHDRATGKLQKWLAGGKRIWWRGLAGTQPGWYPAGQDYRTGFVNGSLSFLAAQ